MGRASPDHDASHPGFHLHAENCGNRPWVQIVTVVHQHRGGRACRRRPAIHRDNLANVNLPRRCSRPGCPQFAVATLTYVYSDSTAVVGPMAIAREPHSWDLCIGHASRITAPRGWELMRHSAPLPTNPDEDDLVALADAVREGRVTCTPPLPGFSDPIGAAHAAATSPGMASGAHRAGSAGRRRGHLRVLPDPAD